MTAAVITAAACLFFWLFFIVPRAREIGKLAGEIEVVRSRIKQAEETFGGHAHFSENVARVQERLAGMEKKLRGGEGISEILKILSFQARLHGVEVISVEPGRARIIPGIGESLSVPGNKAGKIQPITIRLEGSFQSLGSYVGILDEKLPVLFSCEELRMMKDEKTYPRLKAEVVFSVYLFEKT